MLFPFQKVRGEQAKLIKDVVQALEERKNILIHAPTGIGKTAAVISPSLEFALKNNKKIIFVTSRHMQHEIVIETVKKINEKYKQKIKVVEFIGKKHLCLIKSLTRLRASDFFEFCKYMKENKLCEFFNNTVNINKLIKKEIIKATEIKKIGEQLKLCPYESLLSLSREADIIIADYFHIFHPIIKDFFLRKTSTKLEDVILIIDEAHNLPLRMLDMLSDKITSTTIARALKEAEKNKTITKILNKLKEIILSLARENKEIVINRETLIEEIENNLGYEKTIKLLQDFGEKIKEKRKISYCSSIAKFLEAWKKEDKALLRSLNSRDSFCLSIENLNISSITGDVINNTYITTLMSATLRPLQNYKIILGIKNAMLKEYKNPFPEKNRLAMIVPGLTTRYKEREKDLNKYIFLCNDLLEIIEGNVVIFFPSYELMHKIVDKLNIYNKKIYIEEENFSKEQKEKFLDKFKKEKNAALFAVIGANFSEGIDLPYVIDAVVVIGLPFEKPTLKVRKIIEYYETIFGKGVGWQYYIANAFNKALQAAGRCIRTEKDKGIIIFADDRYCWSKFYNYLLDYKPVPTRIYEYRIKEFLSKA